MRELIVDLPRAASHFRCVVEVDFSGHVVVVATPLCQPIAGIGSSNLLIAHLRVGEPSPCIGINQICLHLSHLTLVVTLIDILQIHQVDGLNTVGGIDVTSLGVCIAIVKVGDAQFQTEVVARERRSILALIEHIVSSLYLRDVC